MFHEHKDCEGFFQRGEGDRKIQEKKSEKRYKRNIVRTKEEDPNKMKI